MQKRIAKVVSVFVGSGEGPGKTPCDSLQFELDGIVGDRHRSYTRTTWPADKQPEGTTRRNERQWSAMSVEEIAAISEAMGLTEPLTGADLGANLCLEGIANLSLLPKGSLLQFPSGAELIVEEMNTPCHFMGKHLAETRETQSGKPLTTTAFSKAAKLSRGTIGVVEVTGEVRAGDEVTVVIYETPSWMATSWD